MQSEKNDDELSGIAEVFDSYLRYKDDVKYLEDENLQELKAVIDRLWSEREAKPCLETRQALQTAEVHHGYMTEVAKASEEGLRIIEKNHPEISKLAEMFEKEWKAKWEAERSAAAAERKTAKALGKDGNSGDQTSGEQDSDDYWRTWSKNDSTAWIRNQSVHARTMSKDGTESNTTLDPFADMCTVS